MGTRTPPTFLRTRWAAIGAAIAVTIGGGAIGIVRASVDSGERGVFIPITPCRLFDTRATDTVGPRSTPLTTGDTHTQKVHGVNGNCTIPADAIGVALNVTVVNGTAASFLTVWPADTPRPLAASLNWTPGAPPTPNKVDVDLSADGSIKLYNFAGNVDVVADAVGFYADHTHDDRYYTKAQADARYAPVTHRITHGPASWVPDGLYTNTGMTTAQGCATSRQDFVPIVLPLALPVGATLRSVDVWLRDSTNTTAFTVTLQRNGLQENGLGQATFATATGGSTPSVADKTVIRHLEPAATTVVGESDSFQLYGLNLYLSSGNGVCQVVVEYDMSP
jgi:hypothetical protein